MHWIITPIGSKTQLPFYLHNLTDSPAYYNYVLAFFIKIINDPVLESRIGIIFCELLAIIAFYFFIRTLFGNETAFLSMLLLAISRWHILFTKLIYHAGFLIVFAMLILYFAVKAFKEGKTLYFIFLGLVLSLSICNY